MNERLKKILVLLLILNMPVLLILGSFRVSAFNMYFYENEFSKYEPDVEDAIGITAGLLIFLLDKEASINYISDFNEEEQVHLVEVKDLIHKALKVFYISLLFFVLASAWLFFMDRKNFKFNMGLVCFYGGGLSAVLIMIGSLLSLLNFESVFASFHHLFFVTAWRFPADFLLIKLFPQEFFFDVTLKIVLTAYAASIFFILAGLYSLNKVKYLKRFLNKKKIKK